jgi:GNAT superfamily N-acetyltransferase
LKGDYALGGTIEYDGAAIAAAELRFREDLWRSAPEDAVQEAEIRHRRFGPILATVFGDLPDSSLMNLIQGVAEPGAVEEGHLAEAIEWVRSREVDYRVAVAAGRPGTADAEAWFAARGYEPGPAVRRFAHPGAEATANSTGPLEIRELGPLDGEGMSHIYGDALDLSGLATILMLGLPGREEWHCYRASLGGREVACGSMLIVGKVALIGLEATVPHARGNGCQTALIKRRLADARSHGSAVVVAEVCEAHPASPDAIKNLERLGFEEIPGSATWRRPSGIAEDLW